MKKIYVYTMNGLIEATADTPEKSAIHAYNVITLRAADPTIKLTLIVSEFVFKRKMAEEKTPTFYSC